MSVSDRNLFFFTIVYLSLSTDERELTIRSTVAAAI